MKRWQVGLVLAGLLAGCTSPANGAALPPKPAHQTIVMTEYRFDNPPVVSVGRVIFQVRNAGQVDHKLEMVRLPDDFQGSLDAQLHSANRIAVQGRVSLPAQKPGETSVFAVDLSPGRYGLVCFLPDPDGRTHADKGMSAELDVR